MNVAVLPDVERLAQVFLRNHPALRELGEEEFFTGIERRINVGEHPSDPKYPLVVLQRIGGIPVRRGWLDRARLQVEAWGAEKGDRYKIRRLAAICRAALDEMPASPHELGVVTAVEDDLGLTPSPDPKTGRPRFLFGVRVYVHPPA